MKILHPLHHHHQIHIQNHVWKCPKQYFAFLQFRDKEIELIGFQRYRPFSWLLNAKNVFPGWIKSRQERSTANIWYSMLASIIPISFEFRVDVLSLLWSSISPMIWRNNNFEQGGSEEACSQLGDWQGGQAVVLNVPTTDRKVFVTVSFAIIFISVVTSTSRR